MKLTTKLTPLHTRVLVKRADEETKTPGGIIIPNTAQEKPRHGKVVAVGQGKVLDDGSIRPLHVKINDIVIFGQFSGTEVELDGEKLLIFEENEILGVYGG